MFSASGSAALELLGDLCFTTYASFGAASGRGVWGNLLRCYSWGYTNRDVYLKHKSNKSMLFWNCPHCCRYHLDRLNALLHPKKLVMKIVFFSLGVEIIFLFIDLKMDTLQGTNISHQTGSSENHRLKSTDMGGDMLVFGLVPRAGYFRMFPHTPPKFIIVPEKWWLEDEFPCGIVFF